MPTFLESYDKQLVVGIGAGLSVDVKLLWFW